MPEFLVNLWLRLRALILRPKLERDLDDELAFHLEMRRRKFESAGLAPPAAASSARRHLGNPTLLRETSRSLWTFAWIEALGRDLRYACRSMGRAPVFAAIAIATLAFGIGANTAIFSIVNSVLLRAMPYEKPGEIYSIREAIEAHSQRQTATCINAGNYLEWRRHAHSFQEIAAMIPTNDTLIQGSQTANIHGLRVAASLFALLRVQPRIGRSFTSEEDFVGHGLQMVLTDELWRRLFSANPAIVGQQISLNGYPVTILGVLPPGFYFPKADQIYNGRVAGWDKHIEYFMNLNLPSWDQKPHIGNMNYAAMGRIPTGVSRERALAELEAIENGISRQFSSEYILHAEIVPLQDGVVGPAAKRIWMLAGGSVLVLAIVCVNLAGLMLGRNTARSREVAIRLALGADRWTVLRQFAAEGLALAIAGGVLGLAAAYAGLRLLVRFAPVSLPRLETVSIDGRVLLFSAAVALGAGLLLSVLPALRIENRSVEETLRSSSAGLSASGRNVFLHDLLAGCEIALCTCLLICALLLGQSLSRVLRDNAWLNQDRVAAIEIAPSSKQYGKSAVRAEMYRKLLDEVRQLPGVTNAGLINNLPLHGQMWSSNVDLVEVPRRGPDQPNANFRFLSPGYAEGVGLPLVAGRPMQDSDFGREVMWISESVARQFPGRSPIGMHMRWHLPEGDKEVHIEIAGILADARTEAEEKPPLTVYVPYWLWAPWDPSLVVRNSADPAGVSAAIQRTIRRTHPEIPVLRVETLHDMLYTATASRRFLTRLGVVFAASATFLAALGIYGVVSLATARRRREIAIRMAVGASHPNIFGMIMSKAVRLSSISALAGLAGGVALARAMASLLYEVRPAEPPMYAAACAIVLAVGLAASIIPALRASRLDPVVTLKYE